MKLIQDYYASPLSENGSSATHVKNLMGHFVNISNPRKNLSTRLRTQERLIEETPGEKRKTAKKGLQPLLSYRLSSIS